MKRDDGSVYAIALVAAGALAGVVSNSNRNQGYGSFAFEKKSLSTDVKDGLKIGTAGAGSLVVMSYAFRAARATALLPAPGARGAAAIIIFTALIYTLGRRFITNFMSKDMDGKIRLLRRNVIFLPPLFILPMRKYLKSDENARRLAENLEEFFVDNQDITSDEVVASIDAVSASVQNSVHIGPNSALSAGLLTSVTNQEQTRDSIAAQRVRGSSFRDFDRIDWSTR